MLAVFMALLLAMAYPLAVYLEKIFSKTTTGRFERIMYRAAGVDAAQDMPWTPLRSRLIAVQRARHCGGVRPAAAAIMAAEVIHSICQMWRPTQLSIPQSAS